MKRLILFLFFLSFNLNGQEMPCAFPPGVSIVEKPNVLIVLDVTGSMRWRAAHTLDPDGAGPIPRGGYDPNYRYYGYFHPDSIYQYSSQKFYAVGYSTNRSFNTTNFNPSSDRYHGNILNWAVMSRIDVAKKALTGGAGEPTQAIDKHTLIGLGDGSNIPSESGWPTPSFTVAGNSYRFSKPIYMSNKPTEFYVQIYQSGQWKTIKTYNCRVNVNGVPKEEKCGVIRQIADKDLDGNWDQGKEIPRFGLFFFSTYIWNLPIEFYQTEETPDMEPFLNAINNIVPAGGTPDGDAILESIHYISYVPPHTYSNVQKNLYIHHGRNTRWDPMYSGQGSSLVQIPCRKNFVIIIGDGESNSDHGLISDAHFDFSGPFTRSLCDYDGDNNSYDCRSSNGSHPADDYAYFAHISDVRPDIEGFNNIEFFSLFAFGTGANLFKEIAKDGGFQDKDGDLVPDPEEYDEDNDGVPDNYYEAESGSELEQAIKNIIYEIMARVASGTAVSIITQTSKAEGIAAFASYYPKRFFGNIDISWTGVLRTLFVDRFGFLREDNDKNAKLNLFNDYVITFYFDPSLNQTFLVRFKDVFGNGDSLSEVERVPVEELKSLWDGSERLLNSSPSERNIWTFVDLNQNEFIDIGEYIEFNTSNKIKILPFLELPLTRINFADTLIRYVRGEDFPNLRSRTIPDGRVWKLGDIIFSTPLVVGSPAERYDLIYGDASYKTFYDSYKDRRVNVYVGANDGMFHAFHSGKLIDTRNPVEPIHVDPDGVIIGKEIFAYIPFNLLPHLKWLPRDDYCHVYYVDLKPYPTDVKIFEPSSQHPQGWGTVVIGGMRFGGSPYEGMNFYSSAYFLVDVTDPRNITVLWEKRLPDSSFTTSFPATCKVGDSWFLVIGSGPTNLSDANSYKKANVYILDYSTGEVVKTFNIPDANSFCGDIVTVDYDLDFNVEAIYFGTNILENPSNLTYGGKLYKIETYDDPDPENWELKLVFDAGEPIVSSPSFGLDKQGRIWVYFGTGRFYTADDANYLRTQYLVGVRDEGVSYNLNNLYNVTNVRVFNEDTVKIGGSIISFNQLERLTTQNYKGWYRELYGGERCITSSALIGGSVLFTTYKPEFRPCKAGGEGFLYAIYYLTGTAYYKPIFGEGPGGENLPAISTGPGMPAEPTVYVGSEGEKVFVQMGTGGIVETPSPFPFSVNRSRIILWKGR
ncbi:MAG: PilC/PilY family type IV pilus protein [candidate division WOR-3 bacterium]